MSMINSAVSSEKIISENRFISVQNFYCILKLQKQITS